VSPVTAKEAIGFVRRHGIVLMSARGPVPNLAQAIAGEPIRGSWWAHPKAHTIFRLCGAVSESTDVLVCRLVDGKVTFVHRRLWPAVARLADRLPKRRLAAIREEHTPRGRHEVTETPFPRWVPKEALVRARSLSQQGAVKVIGAELVVHLTAPPGRGGRRET
jgi:hypothetical protein